MEINKLVNMLLKLRVDPVGIYLYDFGPLLKSNAATAR